MNGSSGGTASKKSCPMLHVAAVTDACKKKVTAALTAFKGKGVEESWELRGVKEHGARDTEEAANANTFRVLRNLIKFRTISAKAFYNIAKQLIQLHKN